MHSVFKTGSFLLTNSLRLTTTSRRSLAKNPIKNTNQTLPNQVVNSVQRENALSCSNEEESRLKHIDIVRWFTRLYSLRSFSPPSIVQHRRSFHGPAYYKGTCRLLCFFFLLCVCCIEISLFCLILRRKCVSR